MKSGDKWLFLEATDLYLHIFFNMQLYFILNLISSFIETNFMIFTELILLFFYEWSKKWIV